MNTPAHLILGGAVFARAGRPKVTLAAFAGALLPDLSLYLMVGVSIWVLGVEPRVVFGQYYYSDAWQTVFAIDNSFVFWGAGLGFALWMRSEAGIAFTGAGLLHLAADFLLHNVDARRQFWPLSDWVFVSPVSYWDRRHYGGYVGPAEIVMSLILAALLFRRLKGGGFRALVVALAAAELGASGIWRFVF